MPSCCRRAASGLWVRGNDFFTLGQQLLGPFFILEILVFHVQVAGRQAGLGHGAKIAVPDGLVLFLGLRQDDLHGGVAWASLAQQPRRWAALWQLPAHAGIVGRMRAVAGRAVPCLHEIVMERDERLAAVDAAGVILIGLQRGEPAVRSHTLQAFAPLVDAALFAPRAY